MPMTGTSVKCGSISWRWDYQGLVALVASGLVRLARAMSAASFSADVLETGEIR